MKSSINFNRDLFWALAFHLPILLICLAAVVIVLAKRRQLSRAFLWALSGFGLAGLEPRHAGVNIVFPQSDAACGFAIAAGLCFVSAAIIHTTRPEWRLTAPDKTSSRAR
jgi:hypothetical protein